MRFGRCIEAARRARARLGLNVTALVALLLGVAALVGSLALVAGATEDVSQHNGQALSDPSRLRFFTDHRPEGLIRAAKGLTGIGSVPILALVVVSAGVVFWRAGLRLALVLAPTIALGVAATGVAILKGIVGRARPPVALHLVAERDASFPSGHASDSAAVFLTVALILAIFVLRRPLARVISVASAALLAAAVGASRLVLGVHWPTDVMAGLALGAGVAVAVTMTAALVSRLTPPPVAPSDGRIRRASIRAVQWLTIERRPRAGLQAA